MAISWAESLHIGLADIATRKVRTIVTVAGIVLGVMSIMVVLAIVNSMNANTLDWMQQRGGLNKIEISRNWRYDFSKGGEASFTMREVDYLRSQLPDLEAFNPQVQVWGKTLQNGELTFEGTVKGVYPDMLKVEDWSMQKGRFVNLDDINQHQNVVVLGSTVATELFGSREPLGRYITLGSQKMMVIGVLTPKNWKKEGTDSFGNMLEYMNRQAFVPLSTMLSKIEPSQKVNSIEIKTHDGEQATQLKQQVEAIVLNIKGGKRLFRVSSAKEEMEMMKASMLVFSSIFMLIAVISLLVGGIVIMNIMLASIKERTREIGVRMAIGARGFDIMLQFLVQTILITTMGGVFGILCGWAILGVVGDFLAIELHAAANMVWVALMVSVGVGLLFGIAPAYRASRLDPVIALRED